tara:strand:+ start:173 stop:337 length:165 start_codon:yes stop_codon:yes gene_type:complete
MYVYVLRKAIEMIQYTTRSESELLEEEVDGCLLIVASIWVVVSKRKTRLVKENC